MKTLKVERHGPVGWLINNRPERLNAMNNAMRDEFAEAWKELDADPAVRVIVHTGEGKAFQTGADMIEIASDGLGVRALPPSRARRLRLSLHVLAQRGVEARHHGGERHLRRRGIPLDSRRRHRDRGVRRHVPRPPRVGGTGGGLSKLIGLARRKMPFEAVHAHGPGGTARTHVGTDGRSRWA